MLAGLYVRVIPVLGQNPIGGMFAKAMVELMHSVFRPIEESKLASTGRG